MRIVYINQYHSDLRMSGGTRSYDFARRLVDRGHHVDIITTDTAVTRRGLSWRRRLSWRHSRDDGVDVHWFPVPYSNHMSYGRRIRAFAEFATAAAAKATSLRADVVFATSTPLTVAIPGIVASRLRRVPFVFEIRDLWPEVPIEMGALRNPVTRAIAGGLASWAYRSAAHVIALSPGMAAGVTARYGRARTTVIPNTSNIELFSGHDEGAQRFRESHEWLLDRPLVVYTGTLGAVNGAGYLVRLAARVRSLDPDVRFLLVGSGKEWDHVKRLAADQGVLNTTLRMCPEIPKADIPVMLAATMATSVCRPLPGLWNNSANKFFDSLAAGRPIAINYGGWQADLLRATGAGLVLDPHDVEASARSLVSRLHDREWLAEAGDAARRLAATEFSSEVLFDRFEAVLLAAVSGQHPRRSRRAVWIGGGTMGGTS